MVCTRCGAAMHLLAVITDTQQVHRILRHLIKTGTAPLGRQQVEDLREAPGLDPASVN